LSYDKRIPIRLTSDQLRLIDEAAEKSYHSRRSDWMRAALMAAAELELSPIREVKAWRKFIDDAKENTPCQQDEGEN